MTLTTYKIEEIAEALIAAKNINAAAKSFLKREVAKGSPGEKFVKSARRVLSQNDSVDGVKEFLEKNLEKNEPYIMGLVAKAYSTEIDPIVAQVFDKYADDFNETYSVTNGDFSYEDEGKFKEIVAACDRLIMDALKEAELPTSTFMKLVLYQVIFDDNVRPEALKASA